MGEEYGVGSGHAQAPLLQMAELRVQGKVDKITAATADLVQVKKYRIINCIIQCTEPKKVEHDGF